MHTDKKRMTNGLGRQVTEFLEGKRVEATMARQMAALQIACHFDMAAALAAPPDLRAQIVLRLERAIERERQRGMRRHWSYDLNRHIALKQALDTLRGTAGPGKPSKRGRENGNGARRRRCRSG
jgi:hypothetical protein